MPGTSDLGENDGVFNFDDFGIDATAGTNDILVREMVPMTKGSLTSESPTIVIADYNNDNDNFENWFLNDWDLSNNDSDCGCLDGTLTYNYETTPNDSIAIGFFTIHEDLVGHRKQSSNALVVQADRKVPLQLATVSYSDADF